MQYVFIKNIRVNCFIPLPGQATHLKAMYVYLNYIIMHNDKNIILFDIHTIIYIILSTTYIPGNN